MPKMTKTKLELIPYPDMHILFEKVTRDGIFLFLIDKVKPKINIWNLYPKQESKYYILRGESFAWLCNV